MRLPPGGKVERGETPDGRGGVIPADLSMLDAAIREAREEGIKPVVEEMRHLATMYYDHVDVANRSRITHWWTGPFLGEPQVREEHLIDPRPYHLADIPFDQMWPVERRWLAQALAELDTPSFLPTRLQVIYHDRKVKSIETLLDLPEDPIPLYRHTA